MLDQAITRIELALAQPNYIIEWDAAAIRELLAAVKPKPQEPKPTEGLTPNPGYRLPFGKHVDQRIDSVPLPYLDYLLGLPDLGAVTRANIEAYLKQPEIERELIKQLEWDI